MLPNDKLDVLVVEDSRDDVFLLQQHVQRVQAPRLDLHVAGTLGEALSWLSRHTADVVLLDLSLPDTGGWMAPLISLRQSVPRLPVVVLTERSDPRLSADAVRLGAQDILTKSDLTAERLVQVLRHALERNRLQLQLRASRDSFSSIVEHSPEGILVIGPDRRIRYANTAAGQMLGRSSTVLQGAPVPWRNEDTLLFDLSIRLPSGDGGVGQVHLSETLWAGEPAELVTIRDVSRRRRAEVALQEHNRHLERVRRMEAVGQLAEGVAHEFNNQLMVIQGFTEMALDVLPAEHAVYSHLERVLAAARRSAAITTQLLSLSQRPGFSPQPTRLSGLLREAAELLAPLLGERISLRVDIHDADVVCMVDPREVQQVLMNLAVNARDAMPEGGVLEVGQRVVPTPPGHGHTAWAELWIRDTGAGMDAETRARAFEPFFTTKDVGKGTGLGLSTVYGFVQRWGAQIDLQSAPGDGTTVSIQLPQSELRPRMPTEPPRAPRGQGERILVVEDEAAVRHYLRTLLSEHGYRVAVAAAAAEVLSAPLDPEPAMMLVDVVMPGMSGPQMIALLRERGLQAPVVYLSGYPDRQSTGDAALSEDDTLLRKPVDAYKLLTQLRTVLDAGRER